MRKGWRGGWLRVGRALAVVVTVWAVGGCSDDGRTGEGAPTEATLVTGSTPATTATVATRTTVADPVAAVSGPITGGTYGTNYNPLPRGLADEYDYEESEFFVSGTATSYAPGGALTSDGAWHVQSATSAPYTTRILVRRPADAADFNGTVVVEWLNVTSGMDSDASFGQAHRELLRTGTAWVGVSAQSVGVMGGAARIPIEGFEIRPLREWDPTRYASLSHPGDDFSYDIFTQAAQVLRAPGPVDPLGGLEPTVLLASGESQAAFRMVTYIDAVHPLAGVYDGYLVHSRGRGGAPLSSDPSAVPATGTRIRDDLDVPVLQVQTETDVVRLGSFDARQPDTPRLRTWEVAGTAHADEYTLAYGRASGAVWNPTGAVDLGGFCGAINDGPQTYALRRAVAGLDRWVRQGTPPPSGEPITVASGAIVRDEIGNALGGVRLPAVEVPVATISGEPPGDRSVICSLFGASTPLTPEQLAARYPTHAAYVDAVTAAADQAVAAGFLLEADRDEIVATAAAAPVPA